MNLDENAILSLEIILGDLKTAEGVPVVVGNFHSLSEDIERLEHILAVLRNRKCEGCGEDFGEENKQE